MGKFRPIPGEVYEKDYVVAMCFARIKDGVKNVEEKVNNAKIIASIDSEKLIFNHIKSGVGYGRSILNPNCWQAKYR